MVAWLELYPSTFATKVGMSVGSDDGRVGGENDTEGEVEFVPSIRRCVNVNGVVW